MQKLKIKIIKNETRIRPQPVVHPPHHGVVPPHHVVAPQHHVVAPPHHVAPGYHQPVVHGPTVARPGYHY